MKDRFVLPMFRSEYSDLLQGEDVIVKCNCSLAGISAGLSDLANAVNPSVLPGVGTSSFVM